MRTATEDDVRAELSEPVTDTGASPSLKMSITTRGASIAGVTLNDGALPGFKLFEGEGWQGPGDDEVAPDVIELRGGVNPVDCICDTNKDRT